MKGIKNNSSKGIDKKSSEQKLSNSNKKSNSVKKLEEQAFEEFGPDDL